ncbi:telomerase protein component 1-like [Saccoglossus kowalevskii]
METKNQVSHETKKKTIKAPSPSKLKAYMDYEIPEYDFKVDGDDLEVDIPEFIAPDMDVQMLNLVKPRKEVTIVKTSFVNAVSASLLSSPDFHDRHDNTRLHLMELADKVIMYDPEFILKVGLYARRELNIRSVPNFILALASNRGQCRPFIKKYFNATIRLPSDWIDVAEIYQTLCDKTINFGSLPSALRKAMMIKFPEFDAYQLGECRY